MNKSLGINLDKDILKGGVSASQEALDLWEADEQGKGPTLKNMKLDWNNLRSSWNYRLEELFCAHFCEKMEGDKNEMEEDMCDMFQQCLCRLQRLMMGGLSLDQATAHVRRTLVAVLACQESVAILHAQNSRTSLLESPARFTARRDTHWNIDRQLTSAYYCHQFP
jgi:hypothetical protein